MSIAAALVVAVRDPAHLLRHVIERKHELEAESFAIQEDETGLVTGTTYFGSADEKAGRDYFNWSSRWRRARVFISKVNQFDTINTLQTPRRCLVTLGFNAHASPPAMWTELVCDTGDPNWAGYMWAPERNWLGSIAPDEMRAGDFTVEFYCHVMNLDPLTREPRRGRKRRIVRKMWQCPARFVTRIEVPYMMAIPGFPKIGDQFETYYAAAANDATPSASADSQPQLGSAK